LICLCLTLFGLATEKIWILFGMMFLFCGAMFLVHATASGLVNRLAGNEHRGLTNGLYVAFYYAGGSIGSFAPGIIYSYFGWNSFLILLALVCATGYICINKVQLPIKSQNKAC
ncbi:MAG: MFS transporter, partial [Desulfuromusa sp.]|nr:MFS transporter [Desulfuromusa sp.]